MTTTHKLISSVYGKIEQLLFVISESESDRILIFDLIKALFKHEDFTGQCILYVNDQQEARDHLFKVLFELKKLYSDNFDFWICNKQFHERYEANSGGVFLNKGKRGCAIILGVDNSECSIWVQDPFLVKINKNGDLWLMEPKMAPNSTLADKLVNISKPKDEIQSEQSNDKVLLFHGGNVLNDGETVFIGRNHYEQSVESIFITYFFDIKRRFRGNVDRNSPAVKKYIEERLHLKFLHNAKTQSLLPIGPSIRGALLLGNILSSLKNLNEASGFIDLEKLEDLLEENFLDKGDTLLNDSEFWLSDSWRENLVTEGTEEHISSGENLLNEEKDKIEVQEKSEVKKKEIDIVFEKLIHLDTFLTPLGKIKKENFYDLGVNNPESWWNFTQRKNFNNLDTEVSTILIAELVNLNNERLNNNLANQMDHIANRLITVNNEAKKIFQIVRIKIPLIQYTDKARNTVKYYGTYNNCHVEVFKDESGEEKKRIWLPSLISNFPEELESKLEEIKIIQCENIEILRKLDYDIMLIEADFHHFLKRRGSLHCVSKVLRRKPY